MEASRVTDFLALNMEQRKSRWMRLDISTEGRETGQLNGPQGCPGSRHQLCPLNINWICGVCAAAGTVFPQNQEQGAMPALQTLTVRWLSVKQTHPVVDTEPETSRLETSFSKNTSQLHPLAVGAFPMLLQWPAGSAGLIPAGLKESQGEVLEGIYEDRDLLAEGSPGINRPGPHSACLHLQTRVFGFSVEEGRA